MNSSTIRFIRALLVALFVVAGAVGPAYAQSSPPAQIEEVRVLMEDGWRSSGIHSAADDFVLVCPTLEVLDPSHPCSEGNAAQIQRGGFDAFVLVCPVKEVLDPSHACSDRQAQINRARPDDFVLVCPIKEVLDPSHPCAEQNSSIAQLKIPNDYVLTCPVKEVLEAEHPCAETLQIDPKSRT